MKRVIGLSALLVVYACAIALGIFLYVVLSDAGMNDYFAVLIADVSATVLVWASGVILRTASAYDPYWSLQTLVIYLCLLIKNNNWPRTISNLRKWKKPTKSLKPPQSTKPSR